VKRIEAAIAAILLASTLIGTAFALDVTSTNTCGMKCTINNLERPIVNGNFTASLPTNAELTSLGFPVFIGGGITNYGTRPALNTNMTLYWTINRGGQLIQQNLGSFEIGNIPGRNTHPFALKMYDTATVDFTVVNINATFVWNGT
jgi:hypothetical protein